VNVPTVIGGEEQAPGLSHGVPGYEDAPHDVVLAIMDWVENGKAPSQIIATKFKNDTDTSQGVLRQRPLCPYPQIARYKGGGQCGYT
jgi:feruloyl esterase